MVHDASAPSEFASSFLSAISDLEGERPATGRPRILVADASAEATYLKSALEEQMYDVTVAQSGTEARELVGRGEFQAVVMDVDLPDGDVQLFVRRMQNDGVPVVAVAQVEHVAQAARAIEEGAAHFLTKPVPASTLGVMLERALNTATELDGRAWGNTPAGHRTPTPFVGTSPAMLQLKRVWQEALSHREPVLIEGEAGTGKSVLARWLDGAGGLGGAFATMKCEDAVWERLEHQAAALGRDGILFCHHVDGLPWEMQDKLVKLMQQPTSQWRLVASTTKELDEQVKQGLFDARLYDMLCRTRLQMPPLRSRLADVVPLAEQILTAISFEMARPPLQLTEDAKQALHSYHWHGNVLELRNILERTALLNETGVLRGEELRRHWQGSATPQGADPLSLVEVQKQHIESVLHSEGGHVERAAKRLGVPRSSLYKKLKKLNIQVEKIRPPKRVMSRSTGPAASSSLPEAPVQQPSVQL